MTEQETWKTIQTAVGYLKLVREKKAKMEKIFSRQATTKSTHPMCVKSIAVVDGESFEPWATVIFLQGNAKIAFAHDVILAMLAMEILKECDIWHSYTSFPYVP